MTKFEQHGVNAQMNATTKEEARRSFNWSCRCCCNRGMRIDCNRCAIAYNHYQIMSIFDDLEAMKKSKEAKESNDQTVPQPGIEIEKDPSDQAGSNVVEEDDY